MTTRKAFKKYKDEGRIIGRLLVEYTDVELSLFHCVNAARDDFDTVYKAMFQTRGETRRINMSRTFGRRPYHEVDLGSQFDMAIGSVRHCLKIRNQYAHCRWYDDYSGNLAFVNLEELTENKSVINDFMDLTVRHIDVHTLKKQESFYEYTDKTLEWLNFEFRRRVGKPSRPQEGAPEKLVEPDLFMS